MWLSVSGWFMALRGPLGSQMVELGYQDTDWVGGNDKDVLDGILRQDDLILLVWHCVNFSIKKS